EDVLEKDLGRRGTANAQLVLVGAALCAHRTLDDEGRDLRFAAFFGRRGARKDGEDVGKAAVRDPDLRAVEDVAALGALGAGLDGGGVGSGRRLGQGKGGDELAGREPGQIAALLLLGAEKEN